MPVRVKRREFHSFDERTTKRITLGEKRMGKQQKQEQREITSRISLWDVDSDNAKAPIARGVIQLTAEVVEELYELVQEGEELCELGVSLWETDSENEKAPRFSGKIKSPSEREAEIEAAKAAKAEREGGSKRRTTRRSSK